MREVAGIKAAYDWMVSSSDTAIAEALTSGEIESAGRLEETRAILDRAVFLLLFAQFEAAVTDTFELARMAPSTNPDWKSRRGWDVPAYANRRIPFETKLALVMDRRSDVHSEIMQAYGLRNHCAHGGSSRTVGSIERFVANIYAWQALPRK